MVLDSSPGPPVSVREYALTIITYLLGMEIEAD